MTHYIYRADVWCERCTKAIKRRLKREGRAPANPRDQSSYDSDEYPKGPFGDGEHENSTSDSPEHCAAQEHCLNPLGLSDGSRRGCWLENNLTQEGLAYVLNEVETDPDNLVVQFWAKVYADELESYKNGIFNGENDDESEEDD
jgi:hypothetical protein